LTESYFLGLYLAGAALRAHQGSIGRNDDPIVLAFEIGDFALQRRDQGFILLDAILQGREPSTLRIVVASAITVPVAITIAIAVTFAIAMAMTSERWSREHKCEEYPCENRDNPFHVSIPPETC
jgi:hypothetical protein